MGTRGLLGLIIQAQRHAAYNHFDSYPAGLGQEIVNFILSLQPNDYAIMERNLRDIEWVKEDTTPTPEVQKYYSELGFADLEVNRKRLGDWYCLLRKVQGAAALPEILKGNLKHMIDQGMLNLIHSFFPPMNASLKNEDRLTIYRSGVP
jgi:hypothetical protein